MSENLPGSHRVAIEPLMTNKTYNIIKAIAQIYLPGLGTLYAGLAVLWHFPDVEQVSGTILVIDTFLGLLLGVSTKVYNASAASDPKYAGAMNVRQEDGRTKFTFVLETDPEELVNEQDVVFKVNASK
jgi:imidazoleglycerol phosphate synthase glutamine amidotransferase subunit HisH